MTAYNVLMMGASYGSLLATKLLFGGHKITLVCLPAEIEAFNNDGARVRLPIRGRKEPIELDSRKLPGSLRAAGPGDVDPADYDLVVLAMQEPQYRSPGVRELLDAVAKKRVPCMSIMNMPPLPYLKRIPGLATDPLKPCYTDAGVWDNFEPGLSTLCSPDPQAIRPPGEKINVLQVTLPTNFKAARFAADSHTAMLRQMQADIEAVRYDPGDGAAIDLPVKLKVHDSIFVPLAKWAMLLTGNYRCVRPDGSITIAEAVHNDPDASRAVYNWVTGLSRKDGSVGERSGAVRKIRRRGARSGAAVIGGARARQWRTQYRADRPAGTDDRRTIRHAQRHRRPDRGDGRCPARRQSQKSRRLNSRRRPMPGGHPVAARPCPPRQRG